MKKCVACFQIFIIVCILAGCLRSVDAESSFTTPAQTTPIYSEIPLPSITSTTVGTPEATSSIPSNSPKANITFSPTPNSKGQYEVSNSLEFQNAIGSEREILLFPGDYTQSVVISDVSNLTIIGMPLNDMNYVDYRSPLQFINCSGIKISNLSIECDAGWDGNIEIKNSNNFSLDRCRVSTLNNENGSFYGSGIKLVNVNEFVSSDTIIQNFERNIDLFLTKNSTFIGCTLIGGPLQIGDELNNGPCKNIVFKDCSLLCEAGICATWSNYVPIADKSGYEIEIGTENWQERRFLTAIMYNDQVSSWSGLHYINTYDGSIKIYEDGKFLGLVESLNKIKSVKAFPSLDYIVSEDTDWNQYYSYYGEPESIKLNINVLESDPNPDIEKMMNKTLELKQQGSEILNFNYPITIVYRAASDGANNTNIIAYAEFNNKSFKEFLSCGDISKWQQYCNVIVPVSSPNFIYSFFKIDLENESKANISKIFLTNSLEIENEYGQCLSRLFTISKNDSYYSISAVESFAGEGDFMHYNTDLIIVEDIITNDIYIASDNYYKIDENSNINKDKILDALKRLPDDINQLISGDICEDVILLIKSNDITFETVKFVFLSALKSTNEMSEYSFNYYIATYDTIADKVSKIDSISLCNFKEIIK